MWSWMRSNSERAAAMEFLFQSAHELKVTPIVKYTALSLFADRFYSSLSRTRKGHDDVKNWLSKPMREGTLQLFALISLWISSKIHDSSPLSIKSLKSLGDKSIEEQHFTVRDFLATEVSFLQALDFEIGATKITFLYLEELLDKFKEVAKVGDLVRIEACMDIMDLLYEKEETSALYSSPHSLAASILIASYVITVPRQRAEFPIVSWACIHLNNVDGCSEVCDFIKRRRNRRQHEMHSPACV